MHSLFFTNVIETLDQLTWHWKWCPSVTCNPGSHDKAHEPMSALTVTCQPETDPSNGPFINGHVDCIATPDLS